MLLGDLGDLLLDILTARTEQCAGSCRAQNVRAVRHMAGQVVSAVRKYRKCEESGLFDRAAPDGDMRIGAVRVIGENGLAAQTLTIRRDEHGRIELLVEGNDGAVTNRKRKEFAVRADCDSGNGRTQLLIAEAVIAGGSFERTVEHPQCGILEIILFGDAPCGRLAEKVNDRSDIGTRSSNSSLRHVSACLTVSNSDDGHVLVAVASGEILAEPHIGILLSGVASADCICKSGFHSSSPPFRIPASS